MEAVGGRGVRLVDGPAIASEDSSGDFSPLLFWAKISAVVRFFEGSSCIPSEKESAKGKTTYFGLLDLLLILFDFLTSLSLLVLHPLAIGLENR